MVESGNDIINGFFEIIACIITWLNIYKIEKDKIVKGIYWPTNLFFLIWGLWNLYYYPSLEQYFSFYMGLALAFSNIIWVYLAYKYNKK